MALQVVVALEGGGTGGAIEGTEQGVNILHMPRQFIMLLENLVALLAFELLLLR